jgi:phthalate 4,5-dioxygenase
MQDGEGIHVNYVPRTFIPLANKANNCLMDREAQRHGHSSTGVDGIAMQDASIQESMGAIQDRTKEHLCATDAGTVMTRKILLHAAKSAAKSAAEGGRRPGAGDRAGDAAGALGLRRTRQGHAVYARCQARAVS